MQSELHPRGSGRRVTPRRQGPQGDTAGVDRRLSQSRPVTTSPAPLPPRLPVMVLAGAGWPPNRLCAGELGGQRGHGVPSHLPAGTGRPRAAYRGTEKPSRSDQTLAMTEKLYPDNRSPSCKLSNLKTSSSPTPIACSRRRPLQAGIAGDQSSQVYVEEGWDAWGLGGRTRASFLVSPSSHKPLLRRRAARPDSIHHRLLPQTHQAGSPLPSWVK